MKKKISIFWLIFIILHLASIFFLPQDPNYGSLIIYFSIILLSKIGLPVFINPNSGWGWPEPNFLGWSLGVTTWIILYGILAFTIAKLLPIRKSR